MSNTILDVQKIRSGYGKLQVLHDVSLQISEGEIVSLIGHNGGGKTTALKTMFGLIKAESGSVYFQGKNITNSVASKNVESGISFVPQDNNIFFGFTVKENLKLATHTFQGKISKSDIEKRIDDVYQLFPILKERSSQIAGKLSGGQKQMLAIGMALMHQPKLLMLDEPSIGLAPVLFDQVLDALVKVNKEFGTSILLVEQNVKKSLAISHRAFVMKLGKIQYSFETKNFVEDDLWAMF